MSDERNDENGFEPEDELTDDEPQDDLGSDAVEEHDFEEAEEEDALDDEEEVAGEDLEDGPEPATFAGRRQWGGLPSSGLTEEFDEVEREMADGLDDDLEDEEDAEPVDDELDAGEQPDESEFAGEHTSPLAEEPEGDEPEEVEQPAAEEPGGDEGTEPEEPEAESGKTVEADTPAIADQEEAREKAMAGLQARTAEGQARRGVTEPEAPAAEDATEVAEPPAGAKEAPAEAPPAAPVAAAVADEEEPAEQQKPPKSWLWARFVTASFLIIVSMATATSVSLLVYLTDIAKGLGGLEGLRGQLDDLDEEAQNFLIIGSDVRPDQSGHGLSDTTMLLRVDPERDVISQLSIPRDLETSVPGHGVTKFNEAYSYGGPKLTLETVKQLTDDRIDIDHVVNVDFNGFADAVDAIGCVYIDVDRHYYVSPEEDYAEIDVQAGYQRLCGLKALQYVRFRHADNDIVRAARQQGFLREARQKVPPSELLAQRDELIDIFKKHTTSDIDDVSTLVGLFKLMLQARKAEVNQVTFQTESLNDDGYVTFSDEGIRQSVAEFLNGGEEPTAAEGESSGSDEGDKQGGDGGKKPDAEKPDKEPKPEEPSFASVDLIDSTVSGQENAALMAQEAGDEIKFPIAYPTRLVPNTSISDDTRWFRIDGPGNDIYRGYKFVMPIQTDNGIEYYGASGTNWVDAPLFANESEEREIGGRTYKLYYDAGQLRMVAFEKDKAMYWVTNTLDKALDNEQMLALAHYLAVPDG